MKKYIFLLLFLFCFNLMQVEAANNLMQCDYTLAYGEPEVYFKYRIIYRDDNTILQTMPQFGKEEYSEIQNNIFTPTLFKSSDNSIHGQIQTLGSSFSNTTMKNYYEEGVCPSLVFMITSLNIFPAEDTTLNDGINYVAVEGETTLFNENEEPVEPEVPTLTQACTIHTEDGDINSIPGFTMEFQTYSNGDRYFKVYFTLRGEETAQRSRVETGDVVVRPTDDYGKIYTITLPADEIENVFTSQCLSADQIYFIEEAGIQEARYKISTDAEEAEEYSYSTNFQEGAGSVEVNLDDMNFTTGDCESYLGSITDKTDPAYYLNFAFQILKYAAIVMLFVLTVVDFAKATTSSKDDAIKKALQTAIKRLIIAVIIFFLPILINFILDLLGVVSTNPTCSIE